MTLAACASVAAPGIALDYYEIGNAWLQMERWDKAGEAYEKALSYDRSLIAASYNLARALTESGAYSRAQEVLTGLLADDAENVRLITLQAYAYYRAGDDESALAAYRHAARLNPHDAATLRNLALLLERAGKAEEALSILRELYAVDPSNDAVLRRLALMEARTGAGEAGETLLTAYLARKPQDAEALRARARLREARELFALALEDWSALVREDESDADAWFRLARIRLVVAGDTKAGLEALKRALEAKFADREAAAALLAALPESERARPIQMLTSAGLVE